MLQLDAELAARLSSYWSLAIETNGTIEIPREIAFRLDHVTLSPKVPRDRLEQLTCDTLKLLYPHPDPRIRPEAFTDVHVRGQRYLQPITPMDGYIHGTEESHVQAVVDRLLQGDLPDWRLSLQIHHMIGAE